MIGDPANVARVLVSSFDRIISRLTGALRHAATDEVRRSFIRLWCYSMHARKNLVLRPRAILRFLVIDIVLHADSMYVCLLNLLSLSIYSIRRFCVLRPTWTSTNGRCLVFVTFIWLRVLFITNGTWWTVSTRDPRFPNGVVCNNELVIYGRRATRRSQKMS